MAKSHLVGSKLVQEIAESQHGQIRLGIHIYKKYLLCIPLLSLATSVKYKWNTSEVLIGSTGGIWANKVTGIRARLAAQ